MECKRCGKCCFESFYRHVRPDDLADWEARGRTDLVKAYEDEKMTRGAINREMAESGMTLHACRYLKKDEDRFRCEIYELRPLTCREFTVGCLRLCPRYKGKK